MCRSIQSVRTCSLTLFLTLNAISLGTPSEVIANVYAAHLDAPATWNITNDGPITLSYRLNQTATSVTIEVYRAGNPGTPIATIPGTTDYGLNSVTWDGTGGVTASDYKFRVIANDTVGYASWTNITPLVAGDEIGDAQFFAPTGLAVNRDMANPRFGTVYITSADGDDVSSNPNASAFGEGVFALHNDMSFLNGTAAASFALIPDASTAPGFGDENLSPWRCRLNPDNADELVVSDFLDGYENVWIISGDLGTVQRVLDKTTTGPGTGGQNHGNAVAVALKGTGANRVLYIADEDYHLGTPLASGYSLHQLDIGTTSVDYTGQPLELITGGATPTGADFGFYEVEDIYVGPASGDIWCAHSRTGTNEMAVGRYALNGASGLWEAVASYSNPDFVAQLGGDPWNNTTSIAVNETDDIAGAGRTIGGELLIFQPSDGTVLAKFDSGGNSHHGLDYDAAGNFYSSNQSDEHVRMWSPPDGPNTFTTSYADTISISFGSDSTPPAIVSAVSQRTHGGAGTFNISVNAAGTGIESRSGNPKIVVTFSEPIVGEGGLNNADVTVSSNPASAVAVSSLSISGSDLTVNLTGMATPSRVKLTFPGIEDAAGNNVAGSDTICVAFLTGDVDANASVTIFDLLAVRQVLNSAVTGVNFRRDVDANGGNVTIFDLLAVRQQLNKNLTGIVCP